MRAPTNRRTIENVLLASAVGVVSIIAVVSGFGRSDEDAQDQLPSFQSGVELVTVDVGVVDKKGQPVRGLGPADFAVTVGGQPRRVVTAEFIDVAAARSAPLAGADPASVSTNEGGGTGRLFVFVVDQSTLDPGSARRVATAASHFLSQLTLSDRSAAMLVPAGPNVPFTWAHERVRDALQHATGFERLMTSWEFGSLSEARDISNRNQMALRTVTERECAGSSLASDALPAPLATGTTNSPANGSSSAPGTASPAGGSNTSTQPGSGGTGAASRPGSADGVSAGLGMNPCVRDLQMRADTTWRAVRQTTLASTGALRDLLNGLAHVNGDKTIILISGGWPLDDREETTLMSMIAQEAAAARATVYTLFAGSSSFSAERRRMTTTPMGDRYVQEGPLQTLASMTGGASFHAEVGAEAIFDRLARELGGYYRIAVEREPLDSDGRARHMKVQVAQSGVTVRARDIFDVRTYEDRDWSARMASALESPAPATGVGLRVTSYVTAGQEGGAPLKLMLAGEASRLQAGNASLRVLVNDVNGNKVFSGEQPLGDVAAGVLPFSTNLPLAPGSYIIRLAVMDGAGRVGSVDHRVDVRPAALGALSVTGPLLIRVPAGNGDARLALGSVGQDERLAIEVDLDGDTARLADPHVTFEIATPDGAPLVTAAASLSAGSRAGALVAQAVAEMRLLPAGTYLVRANVSSGSERLGDVHRTFTVEGTPGARTARANAAASGVPATRTVAMALRAPAGIVQPFSLDEVLAPSVVSAFLDRVAEHPDAASPAMRDLLEHARTTKLAELTVPDGPGSDGAIAAFIKGLSLLAQQKLNPAATAFRAAMHAAPDFYPAIVYLGACYAAGGHDKDAAGAWRTALIREADAAPLHIWLTDALLRQGEADSALAEIEEARLRWPEDTVLKRRSVIALLLAGRTSDGLDALDGLVAAKADDEGTLAYGLLVLYEAFVERHPVESVDSDRARMLRLAASYRARGGTSQALVDTWVAAVKKGKS